MLARAARLGHIRPHEAGFFDQRLHARHSLVDALRGIRSAGSEGVEILADVQPRKTACCGADATFILIESCRTVPIMLLCSRNLFCGRRGFHDIVGRIAGMSSASGDAAAVPEVVCAAEASNDGWVKLFPVLIGTTKPQINSGEANIQTQSPSRCASERSSERGRVASNDRHAFQRRLGMTLKGLRRAQMLQADTTRVKLDIGRLPRRD